MYATASANSDVVRNRSFASHSRSHSAEPLDVEGGRGAREKTQRNEFSAHPNGIHNRVQRAIQRDAKALTNAAIVARRDGAACCERLNARQAAQQTCRGPRSRSAPPSPSVSHPVYRIEQWPLGGGLFPARPRLRQEAIVQDHFARRFVTQRCAQQL